MRRMVTSAVIGLAALAGCGNSLSLDEIVLSWDRQITVTPADLGYPYEERSVPVGPGRSVMIWYVPSPPSKALVVVIPGSGGNKSLYATLAFPVLGDRGYDILLMDYEGFGDSPGEASLEHVVDDALAVTGYAMTLHKKVIAFGVSLGSPIAARVAAEYDVAGLIMESSLVVSDVMENVLASMPLPQRMFYQVIGPELVRTQLPEDFDMLAYVPKVRGPKLIIHSPDDSLTPLESALTVYEAASPPKTFWQTYGDHCMMIYLEPDVYGLTLTSWLDSVTSQP